MAVKAKKRKLVNATRQDQDAKVPQNKAEAELQRQEDEMLAMTRLLKRVDKKDALTVAKKILENTTTTTALEETSKSTEAVNGAAPTPNGSSSKPNRPLDQSSNSHEPRQSRTGSRLRQEIATNVTPSPVHGNKYATRETRSKAAVTNSLSTATATTATTTNGNGLANGSGSKNRRGVSSEGSESETWLADLTIANVQKQNDAHEQEDQRLQEIKEVNVTTSISAANGSAADGAAPSTSKRSFVSVLRSGRRRVVPLPEATDPTGLGHVSSNQGLIGNSSVSVKSAPSVISDTSTSFVASIISESFGSSDPNAVPNISVTFKPEGEGDADPLRVPGFEIPISALIQPRLTKTLIQQKARSTYAPPTLNQTEQPRRKPGRPPGYFLGPTSCAYCRAQHRRCDFNTVCIRCIKAKIPCDRSGTVDRPTIIVREARQQAKAEAAAALAAAVAAGLAIAPEKPRPANRYSQLHALTMEAASITSKFSSPPPPEPTPSAGIKRRRSPSPSDVSRGNIIEQKVKRVASVNPIQKYDPSAYLKPHNKANGLKVRKLVNGESNKGYISSTEVTSTGSLSGNTSDAGPSSSSAGQKRKPGRPATKYDESIQPAFKRSVGRPPNSVRYALNPSLIPQPKLKRKPGRPPKSSAGTSTSIVPSKRSRNSSKNARGKAISYTKNSKGKQVAEDSEDDEESDATNDEPEKPSVRLVRKMYLKSGLYSADLKVNPVNNSKLSVTLKQASKQASKHPQTSKALVSQNKRLSRAGGSSQSGPFFQLPINYGSVLISTEKDFCLPFDIMQAWQAGLLRKTIQPEPFVKIRSNIFLERKRRTETSPMVCHCTPPPPGAGRVGCGEDCYNRVMFYECISAHCPCGDQCSNQRFQKKHKEDHLRVIWTQERGFGIQTLAPIKKGNLVIEYRGEVISQSECHRRMETIYKNNKNFYFLEYEKGEVVDACQKGTIARFVNHSCSPNSQIEKWFLNGEMSIGIFASQDIPVGAEISYDYNFSSFSGAQKQKCRCGAPNCRGYIGERISKNKEPAPVAQSSGRSGKKADTRKRKAGRRKVNDQEPSSIRLTQMPSVRQIRQRQSDKYKEDKMAAIRYTKLFLFRNIRLVESKYIKYARTKSRSYQETVSRSWLMQARQCRKRSLEGVMDDLRAAAKEQEEEEFREQREESNSVGGDDGSDPSVSVTADENSIVLELDAEDADAMDEYDDENSEDEEQEDEIDELEEDNDENTTKVGDELEEEDELEDDELELQNEEDEVDELESESD
ncbi:Histone-Lysine N-Methyltransferase ash1l [Mortierella sp. AD094]|nr:Histone-Lysine N-Methyltransferase ash1l [Mortierella sp. AD094]